MAFSVDDNGMGWSCCPYVFFHKELFGDVSKSIGHQPLEVFEYVVMTSPDLVYQNIWIISPLGIYKILASNFLDIDICIFGLVH